MKKIVFVIETLYGGGAERVTAALANEMCRDNENRIHVITFSRDENKDYWTDRRIIHHEVGIITGGNRVQRIYKRIARIRGIVKEIDPYCVVSLGSPIIVNPLVVAMFGLGYPLILSERNDPRNFPASKFQRFSRIICYTYCAGLVFQTHEAKEYFLGFMQKKSVVICNPLTSQLPEPHQGERDLRIVNFCRLVPQKNLDLLIDAFSDIHDCFPEHSLHIYGDGEERERLETKIRQMNLQDKVILHGYSNNIYEEINNAALFVSSSDYEGISNSMLEAISLGIPSICTDCPAGGARDIIKHGCNGMLVAVGDRRGLSQMMKEVLSNKELSQTISEGGLILRDELCVSEISKKWMEAIEAFVDKKHG